MISLSELKIGDIVYLSENDGFDMVSIPYQIVAHEGEAFIGWNNNMEISDYIEAGMEHIHTDYPLYPVLKQFELIGTFEDVKASYEEYLKHRDGLLSER